MILEVIGFQVTTVKWSLTFFFISNHLVKGHIKNASNMCKKKRKNKENRKQRRAKKKRLKWNSRANHLFRDFLEAQSPSIKKREKSACEAKLLKYEKVPADTISSGSEFQIFITLFQLHCRMSVESYSFLSNYSCPTWRHYFEDIILYVKMTVSVCLCVLSSSWLDETISAKKINKNNIPKFRN